MNERLSQEEKKSRDKLFDGGPLSEQEIESLLNSLDEVRDFSAQHEEKRESLERMRYTVAVLDSLPDATTYASRIEDLHKDIGRLEQDVRIEEIDLEHKRRWFESIIHETLEALADYREKLADHFRAEDWEGYKGIRAEMLEVHDHIERTVLSPASVPDALRGIPLEHELREAFTQLLNEDSVNMEKILGAERARADREKFISALKPGTIDVDDLKEAPHENTMPFMKMPPTPENLPVAPKKYELFVDEDDEKNLPELQLDEPKPQEGELAEMLDTPEAYDQALKPLLERAEALARGTYSGTLEKSHIFREGEELQSELMWLDRRAIPMKEIMRKSRYRESLGNLLRNIGRQLAVLHGEKPQLDNGEIAKSEASLSEAHAMRERVRAQYTSVQHQLTVDQRRTFRGRLAHLDTLVRHATVREAMAQAQVEAPKIASLASSLVSSQAPTGKGSWLGALGSAFRLKE